jgi:hypothetical protein
MPKTAPSNRPGKGQPKPRQWKVAREQARAAKAAPKTRAKSALQVAQAKERADVKAATKADRAARLEEMKEIRTRAVQAGLVEHGLDPIQVLQRLIDDAFIQYLLAQQDLDGFLADHPNVTDNLDTGSPYVKEARRLENRVRAYRRESAYFSGLSVQYNLQERQTQVAEARIALFMQAMQQALRHPDIDLPPDKYKLLPGIMQKALQDLRSEKG